MKTSGGRSCCENGKNARPLGRPGRAFRCPELRLELNWLRLLASKTLLDLLCGDRQRFEGQAVELSRLRDVESGSSFCRSRYFGAFKREAAGATLAVTAAWFASFLSERPI